MILFYVSVPVLSVHKIFIAPKFWMALSRFTMALRRAITTAAALAQNSNSTQNASAKGEWQASKLIHMNVYNGQNQKIGDIKELMLDKSGKIANVVIGVSGFLGMGEHDVAVSFDRLKW